MTKITILLPTYNRRALLPRALESIHAQTFHDWRLLVLNDGGEDVGDIVASFNDERMEYHALEHLGKAGALNHGLKLVHSEYIAYMDDDDIWYPNHLEVVFSFAAENHHDFVYSDTLAIVMDSKGKVLQSYIENNRDVTWDELKYQNFINHKQILHTRSLADKTGLYDERLTILIDYDYIRRMSRHATPQHINTVTGEHFLMTSDRHHIVNSITGRWTSDPHGSGQSVLHIFEKSPEVMTDIYRKFASYDIAQRENKDLHKQLARQNRKIEMLEKKLDMLTNK